MIQGQATVNDQDHPAELAYFRSQGYRVEELVYEAFGAEELVDGPSE